MSRLAQLEQEIASERAVIELRMKHRDYRAVFGGVRSILEQICKHEQPNVDDAGIAMRLQVMSQTLPTAVARSIRYAYDMGSWGVHHADPHQGTPTEADANLTLFHVGLVLDWFARRTQSGALRAIAIQLKRHQRHTLFHFGAAPTWGANPRHYFWLQGEGAFLRIDRKGNVGTTFTVAEPVAAVAAADDGSLWVASRSGGVLRLHGDATRAGEPVATEAPALCLARCDALMLGGDAHGVRALNGDRNACALPSAAVQIHAVSTTLALVVDAGGDVHVTAWPEGTLRYSFSSVERRAGVRMVAADREGSGTVVCVGDEEIWRVAVPSTHAQAASVVRGPVGPRATLEFDVRSVTPLGYRDHLVVLTTDGAMHVLADDMSSRPVRLPHRDVAVRGVVARGEGHGVAFWTGAGELGLVPAQPTPSAQLFEGDVALLLPSRVRPSEVFAIHWEQDDRVLWYESNVAAVQRALRVDDEPRGTGAAPVETPASTTVRDGVVVRGEHPHGSPARRTWRTHPWTFILAILVVSASALGASLFALMRGAPEGGLRLEIQSLAQDIASLGPQPTWKGAPLYCETAKLRLVAAHAPQSEAPILVHAIVLEVEPEADAPQQRNACEVDTLSARPHGIVLRETYVFDVVAGGAGRAKRIRGRYIASADKRGALPVAGANLFEVGEEKRALTLKPGEEPQGFDVFVTARERGIYRVRFRADYDADGAKTTRTAEFFLGM